MKIQYNPVDERFRFDRQLVKIGDVLMCKKTSYTANDIFKYGTFLDGTFFLKKIWLYFFSKPIFEKGKRYVVSDVKHEVVSYSGPSTITLSPL